MYYFSINIPDDSLRINVRVNNKRILLVPGKIMYICSQGSYCNIHVADDKKYLTSESISKMKMILNANGFVRIHQSLLVNLFYIESITTNGSQHITLFNGEKLQVSRKYKPLLMAAVKGIEPDIE